MTAFATLKVGDHTVDEGYDGFYRLHGALFRDEDTENNRAALPLSAVKGRLELLGYTLPRSIAMARDVRLPLDALQEAMEYKFIDQSEYDALVDYLQAVKSHELKANFAGHFGRDLPDSGLDIYHVIERLAPTYAQLRILAESADFEQLDTIWDYSDPIATGELALTAIRDSASLKRQYLIVTEGSSDATIVRHALKQLRPHISDFFHFVDMDKGYPFSGTGSQFNFTKGLLSIGVENQVVILFDNDAAGVEKYLETEALDLPANMKAIRLPNCESFNEFSTVGPNGKWRSNINEKAASIECYLDLQFDNTSEAVVRWTSYNSRTETYQGELEHKSSYMKTFLREKELRSDYDYSKLTLALDHIASACVDIAEANPYHPPFPFI